MEEELAQLMQVDISIIAGFGLIAKVVIDAVMGMVDTYS